MSLHCITTCSLITALTNILTNSDIHFDNIVGNIDNQVPLWEEQACSDENDADDVRDAGPATNSDKYWQIFWQHSDKYIDKIVRNSVQMRTLLMTSEMLWPAAAASSRGQGLQSALEQTFTKISCSFFNIELSNKNGKALKMRQYKNATKSPPLVKSKSSLTSGNSPSSLFIRLQQNPNESHALHRDGV